MDNRARRILYFTGVVHLSLLVNVASSMVMHPHTDPANDGGWLLKPEVSDEFDGDQVDTGKWHIQGTDGVYRNNFRGRAPSQFTPANVNVAGGLLRIVTKWEPEFDYFDKPHDGRKYENITTGAIITKSAFLHGYMEIRCKAAKGPISSAFWAIGDKGELDVFEHWGDARRKPASIRRYHTSFHDWRVPGSPTWAKRIWTNDHLLDFAVTDDFHVYALEWDPDYLKIFVDGRLIRHVTRAEIGDDWVLDHPQNVWLDCEVFPWEVKASELTAEDYPGDGLEFLVDYVRIWQRQGEGPRPECPDRTNLVACPGFETDDGSWTVTGQVQRVVGHSIEGTHAVFLEAEGRVEQVVPVKPDTTYVFSAWSKVPGTNMSNIWQNSWIGVKVQGAEEIRRQYFHPTYYRSSIQFTTGPAATSATIFFTNDASGHATYADGFELFEAPVLGRGCE